MGSVLDNSATGDDSLSPLIHSRTSLQHSSRTGSNLFYNAMFSDASTKLIVDGKPTDKHIRADNEQPIDLLKTPIFPPLFC